jgi:hypothetical protein
MGKPFDVSKFRKDITKSIDGDVIVEEVHEQPTE